MSCRRKKWAGRGGVVFWLAASLALHGALLAIPSVSLRPERPASPVEVGLLPLAPRLAGDRTAGDAPTPRSTERPLPVPSLPPSPVAAAVTPEIEPVATGPAPPSPDEADAPSPPELPPSPQEAGAGAASATVPLIEALPRYDRNAPPAYPRLARQNGWEGEALLRVAVTEAGRVRAAEIERSSGYPLLDRAALEAVRRWHFHPARRGEAPVAGEVRVPVRFELR